MAGQSQSPVGSVAMTSTRPYLIVAPFFVLMRPDLTGGMIVPLVVFVTALHSKKVVPVQLLSRFRVWFWVMSLLSWRVGLIWRLPFWRNTFSLVAVAWLNSPLLNTFL